MEDYYKLLEVTYKATTEEIKKRCQELLLKHHPDKQASQESARSTSLFLKIQEARNILLDEQQRQDYDRRLKEKDLENFHRPIYLKVEVDELEFDEVTNEYFTECRCGGSYVVHKDELKSGSICIPCEDCTYYLEVISKKGNKFHWTDYEDGDSMGV